MKFYIFIFLFSKIMAKILDIEKVKFCSNLKCDVASDTNVCGMRIEENGIRLRLFQNECDLLKYGCSVDENLAYGLINKVYCDQTITDDFSESSKNNVQKFDNVLFNGSTTAKYIDHICINEATGEVCGVRKHGGGYFISLFRNKCEMDKYNCENLEKYNVTDLFICKQSNINVKNEIENITNLVIVNGNMLGQYGDLNDTIDTFFAASHVFDLPVKEIQPQNTRRRLLKYAGPVKVFVPWIVKPQNISNDTFHTPTLSSCYHKCPIKCPDTYAPVCGVPGIVAREPSIMFQNHCFMDVAQCKMFWEGKSSTAHSSSYVEASFLFCMGDEMNAVYRFLPAIRTLQHMGRLKKKGKFRAKLRNFRFLSDFRSGHPKFMG